MKYLVVNEPRQDWNEIREAVEKNSYSFYYLQLVKMGRTQIVFPQRDLTKKLAIDIALSLGMKLKWKGKNKAILYY